MNMNNVLQFLPTLDQISSRFASVGEVLGISLANAAEKAGSTVSTVGEVISTAFQAGASASSDALASTGGLFVNTGMTMGSMTFPGFSAPSAPSAISGFASLGLTAGAFFTSLAASTGEGIIAVVGKVQSFLPPQSNNISVNAVLPEPESSNTTKTETTLSESNIEVKTEG
jgi:hypothetical protein